MGLFLLDQVELLDAGQLWKRLDLWLLLVAGPVMIFKTEEKLWKKVDFHSKMSTTALAKLRVEDSMTSLQMQRLEFYKPTLVCLVLFEGRNNMLSSFSTQILSYLIIVLFERKLPTSLIYQVITNC